MSGERRWFPVGEPFCGEPHPTVKYLCGFNKGHAGDHCEAICFNTWPNTTNPEENL